MTRFHPRNSSRRKGAVFGLFIVAMVALLAAVAAAIDVGRLTVIRQHMQVATDMAACAGVSAHKVDTQSQIWDLAAQLYTVNMFGTSSSAPQPTRITTVTDGTHFPGLNTGAQYRIGGDLVTVRYPFEDSLTIQRGYDPYKTVQVEATRTAPMLFTRMLGIDQAVVNVRSGAVTEDAGRKCLIITLDPDPAVTGFDWTSTGANLQGDIHCNSTADISGGDKTCTGWIDYASDIKVAGAYPNFDMGPRLNTIWDDPVKLTIDDFLTPDTSVYTGQVYVFGSPTSPYNWSPTGNVIPAGIYVVYGNITISGSDVPEGPVTFVATGDIHAAGTDHDMTAAYLNMLFFTTASDKQAMNISAQGGSWTGMFYAPNGNIQFTASGGASYSGGIVGDTVNLSGQNFTAKGTLIPTGDYYSHLFR